MLQLARVIHFEEGLWTGNNVLAVRIHRAEIAREHTTKHTHHGLCADEKEHGRPERAVVAPEEFGLYEHSHEDESDEERHHDDQQLEVKHRGPIGIVVSSDLSSGAHLDCFTLPCCLLGCFLCFCLLCSERIGTIG